MAAALGNQGELSATHLTLRWSVGCKRELPVYVEVKLPREYLFQRPVFLHENCIKEISAALAIPGGAPWPDNARREGVVVDPKSLVAHPRRWPQLVHLVLKQGAPSAGTRSSYWHDQTRDREIYMRVENLAGLERHVRFSCFSESDAKNHPGTRAFLAAKPPDDKAPPNCWTVPGTAILITPSSVSNDEELRAIVCEQPSCNAYFAAGLLSLEVNIPHSNLEHWQEIISSARALALSFIVHESLGAYEAGAKTFRTSDLNR